ncbi:MAG TPA: four helix bundle protein [Thermoanaerobaculia bacterium]
MSESFRDLIVWQRAMALVTDIYVATEAFPSREKYGLTNQICRAAVAIPSDIAEGKGRLSKKEFLQMLARARGSTFEVQTQLEISRNLQFLANDTFATLEAKAAEVGRLLNGLIANLEKQIEDQDPPKPPRSPKS